MLTRLLDFICLWIANSIVRLLMSLPRRNCYETTPAARKKRVLILANNRIGDSLVRLPFHDAMRRVFPPETHHIAIVLEPAMAALFSRLPYFDEIIPASSLHFRHALFWIFTKRDFCGTNLIRWAFWHKVDIFIETIKGRPIGSDYIVRLSRPSLSIAYSLFERASLFPATEHYQRRNCDKLYTHILPSRYGLSQLDDYQKILNCSTNNDILLTPVSPRLLRPMIDTSVSSAIMKPYIVLVPGAMDEGRRWPVARFAEIAQRLKGEIVVVGSASEKRLGDNIPSALNLCGKTSLPQLGGILAAASLVITNETGTATFAAVLGAPTVIILGGSDFGSFFPAGHYSNTRSVFHLDSCFGCGATCSKRTKTSSEASYCIKSVSVEDVVNTATLLLHSFSSKITEPKPSP